MQNLPSLGLLILLSFNIILLFKFIFKKKLTKVIYELPFTYTYSKCQLPLMKFKIADKFYYFLLDSGSNINIINKSFWETHKNLFTFINRESNYDINFGQHTFKAAERIITTLGYGNLKFIDTTFAITDISSPLTILEKEIQEPIIGIISSEFMHEYNMQLDFKHLSITISSK